MKNPLNEREFSKLKASLDASDQRLVYAKKQRIQTIKELCGYHYAEDGAQLRVIIPMLALAFQIYVRQLAARSPRVLITTKSLQLQSIAANMELALNQIPDEINLTDTLRKMVGETLFFMGVVKVGLHKVGTALNHEYGKVFVDSVPSDDYFLDMSAKNRNDIDYEGNTYWVDYDEAMEASWLNKSIRDELKPDEYTVIGPSGESRAESISASQDTKTYRDRLWLRDIWLPREGALITIGNKTKTFLKAVEWTGPSCGPYYKLGFIDVPGNLLPLPPTALWRDLHELANETFRKTAEQARAQKTVLGFPGGDDESVNNFKNAKDGSGIRYTGAPPMKLTAGGVDEKLLAFELQLRSLFSYYAGNIDSLGGLQVQAPTLGQDRLLSEASSAQMRDMADKTVSVIRDIFRAIAFYEWNDPVSRRILEKPIPGTEETISVEWNKASKIGDLEMYDLDIDVYSLQDNSPAVRLQKLGVILKEYVFPLLPQIEQAGGTVDVQKILKLIAKFSDLPELDDVVQFVESDMGDAIQPKSSGTQANTTHTSTRVGQPGMSRQGADAVLSQQLLSMGNAGSEGGGAGT